MKVLVSSARVVFMGMVLLLPLSATPLAGHGGDLWIKAAVETVIERDGRLDLDDIRVSCHNGIVKLSGTVLADEEKGLAAQLVMEVPDVRGIENNIQVVPVLSENIKVEKEAEATLLANPLLHIRELKIRALYGMVTVKGIVYHKSEKIFVTELLSDLPDVKQVINKIEVL